MNIIHLITTINKGGAENHLYYLTKGMRKKNNITVVYYKGDNYWKKHYNKLGIKTINLSNLGTSFFSNIKKVFFLRDYIKSNKFDIVHSHLPHMEFLMYFVLIFNKHNFKYFITKHVDNNFLGGSRYPSNNLIVHLIDFILTYKANKIICISKAVKNYYLNKILSKKSKKYKIIYYGINKQYKSKLNYNSKIKNIPKRDVIFGSVGRLVKQKNFELIIKSYKSFVDKADKSSCLVIAGSGPEETNLKNFAKKLNIADNIIWMGHVNNIGKVFNKIDVFCMNSKFEGLGLVLLEAMLFSRPIIATNISAIPEVVVNMKNGILVEQNNVNKFSKAMSILSDKNLRQKLSKNSHIFLNKKFNYNKMIKKTMDLYLH